MTPFTIHLTIQDDLVALSREARPLAGSYGAVVRLPEGNGFVCGNPYDYSMWEDRAFRFADAAQAAAFIARHPELPDGCEVVTYEAPAAQDVGVPPSRADRWQAAVSAVREAHGALEAALADLRGLLDEAEGRD